MYVYLRSGKHIKRFQDIELVDCVEPQVDGVSMEGTDPAVWFKVLFLDSMLVDCDEREVYWNKDTVVEATDIHWTQDDDLDVDSVLPFYQNQGKMFNSGCYDFDVYVDELFDEARLIIDGATEVTDAKEEAILKQGLFRLLHVFILPKLILKTNDLKELNSTLPMVESICKDLKVRIANKEKQQIAAEKSLEKQRRHLLAHQNFTGEKFVSSCNYEFLKEFLKHLQNDVVTANKILVEFDDKISPLRSSQTEKDIKRLNSLRAEREKTLSLLNETVMARETVKNVIARPRKDQVELFESKETAVHPNHMIYMEVACRFQTVSDEIKKLTDTLCKVTAVKEAFVQSISEIEKHGESHGHQTTLSESVLYCKGDSENWSCLSKKVDNLVNAKPLGFRNKHKKFCKKIISKCQKLFDGSKSPSSCGFNNKEKSCDIDRNMTLATAVLHDYGNKPNATEEIISREVIKHTSEMASTLAEELFKKPVSEIRQSVLENIYICYETHVSEEIMPVLHQLYENSYKQQCEALSRWFTQKKLSENLLGKVDGNETNDLNTEHSYNGSFSPIESVCNQAFKTFETLVQNETETMSVFTKLRKIMETVQYVEKRAREVGDKSNPVCTDDILDVIILLLQKLDSETFLKMYAHINMLRHLSPDFIEGNCHEYALISFYAAYQHLFDQHVLDTVLKKNAGVFSKVS